MELTYDGLDSLEQAILRQSSEFAYVTLNDRSSEPRECQLARIEFSPEELAPYLSSDDDEDALELDDEEETQSPEDSPIAKALYEANSSQRPPDHLAMLRAVCRWLRANVALNMVGVSTRNFRCRAYAVKGSKALLTASFSATNPEVAPPPALRKRSGAGGNALAAWTNAAQEGVLPIPEESLIAHHVLLHAAAANQHLNSGYNAFNELMLDGMRGLQEAMSLANRDLSSQLSASREYQTSLLGALMERNKLEVETGMRGLEYREQEQRTALAREAIDTFGNTAQMLFMSRMGHPLAVPLAQVLQTSPRLAQALSRRDVQQVLQDPRALEALAQILEGAVQQFGQPQRQGPWSGGMAPGNQYGPGQGTAPQAQGAAVGLRIGPLSEYQAVNAGAPAMRQVPPAQQVGPLRQGATHPNTGAQQNAPASGNPSVPLA